MLPENGPVGYQRNIEQLLEYERIFYDRTSSGVPAEQLKRQYETKLIKLPDTFDEDDLPEIFAPVAQTKHDLLLKLRRQIFGLYGVAMPESTTEPLRKTSWNTIYKAIDGRTDIKATMRLNGVNGTYSLAGQNAVGTLSKVGYFLQPNGDILIDADWVLNGVNGTVEFTVPNGNRNSLSGIWTCGNLKGPWNGTRIK